MFNFAKNVVDMVPPLISKKSVVVVFPTIINPFENGKTKQDLTFVFCGT